MVSWQPSCKAVTIQCFCLTSDFIPQGRIFFWIALQKPVPWNHPIEKLGSWLLGYNTCDFIWEMTIEWDFLNNPCAKLMIRKYVVKICATYLFLMYFSTIIPQTASQNAYFQSFWHSPITSVFTIQFLYNFVKFVVADVSSPDLILTLLFSSFVD